MQSQPTGGDGQHNLDALGTFERLREAFFRYYDTPFGLADRRLQSERRELLDRDGGIYRRPLIELRPQYVTTGHSLADSAKAAGAPPEVAGFGAAGLIPEGRELYTHQEQSLRYGMQPGRNVVVTAGTGSGKTESFLLPVLAGLLEESREWQGKAAGSSTWWRTDSDPFASQRGGETGRAQAVRAIVLYPMNALVDDQLLRLRKALDSDKARAWLDEHRRGNRFYFGRYTGATPVTGSRTDTRAVSDLRRYLQATDRRGKQARKLSRERCKEDLQYYVPRLDGAEMRSRWDMIDSPPDILITNYSMLGVMLLRERDGHFFDSTRAWLDADERHRFTLVVDELHSYRGTAGTEVALLIRNLKHRLGLSGRPHKLRVLAASASLDADRDREYLQQFFGLPQDSFEFLEGETTSPDSLTLDLSDAAPALAAVTTAGPGAALQAAQHLDAAAALHNAFHTGPSGQRLRRPQTQTARQLGETLFPGRPQPEQHAATAALLTAVREAGEDPDWPKLRAHLFFRNVPGLWACTDPGCPDIPGGSYEGRTVGRLFAGPATRCTCRARVLELHYCQNCGDVLLGGFSAEGATQKTGRVTALLLADVPELAKLPDQATLERTAANYLLYWPRTERPEIEDLDWTADSGNVSYEYRRSRLSPANGELANTADGHTGWSFHATSARHKRGPRAGQWRRDPSSLSPFPTLCPNCGDDWEIRYGRDGRRLPHTDPGRQRSPVRGLRTGFEKINQVLVTELASQLSDAQRKLIVFTDSRQDAAKLSAGMGLRHYQDLLRLLLHEAMGNSPDGAADIEAARRYVADRDKTPDNYAALNRLLEKDAPAAGRLRDVWDGAPGADSAEEADLIARLVAPPSLQGLATGIGTELLKLGTNPGGPHASKDATPWRSGGHKRWPSLYDWDSLQPRAGLDDEQKSLLGDLGISLRQELLSGLFSGAGRDFESLGLGWLALASDTSTAELEPTSQHGLARASLRVLGDARRFFGVRDGRPSAPPKLRRFWMTAAECLHTTEEEIRQAVLASWGDSVVDYLIDPAKVVLRQPGPDAWMCPKCRRQHLHPGCGLCTWCRRPLLQGAQPTAHEQDYYAWKATVGVGRFRLACAELTGQTDRADAQSRQSRFQGVFLDDRDENPRADGVDLLSVTTTMEAGVDIGALEVVVLGNMPPTRFNYQQRVGRAGRRSAPVAVALTVCRGRSHDEYYFDRPELITNEPTPKPYLALDRTEIYRRALCSEVLRMAYTELGATLLDSTDATDLTHNPHGQFGLAAEWPLMRDHVQGWLDDNTDQIRQASAALAESAPASISTADWASWCQTNLVAHIDRAVTGGHAGHSDLSQRLAENGLLPMFGFPTRVRYLHLTRPYQAYPWPPPRVIDRDLAMAVSQFAPLSEVVRDGRIYSVVGIAAFQPTKPKPRPEDDSMGIARRVEVCRSCSYVEEPPGDTPGQDGPCPRCSAAPGVFQSVDVREPLGFRAGHPRDFNGEFSWSARAMAGRALTDLEALRQVPSAAAIAHSGPGKRFVINDNGGKLFRFRPAVPSTHGDWGGYVAVDAVEKDLLPDSSSTGAPFSVALGSVQPTDFLFLGPAEPVLHEEGLRLNLDNSRRQPHGPAETPDGRRGAWYSLAFLLRTVAAAQLDIQTLELTGGIYSGVRHDVPTTFAFLADTLENGAGFSTHLGEPDVLAKLLDNVEDYLHSLMQPAHANDCSASCYKCLRDYSNMAYHALLDWRLAGDLFQLLRGQPLPDSRQREDAILIKWVQAYSARPVQGLPAAAALWEHPAHGRFAVVARHPLEAAEHTLIAPRLAETLTTLEATIPDADGIVFADSFTLDRDPGRVLAMFAEVRRP